MTSNTTTIFTTMSALAQENQAINLAQGFPGFACDDALIEKAYQYMKEGHNQYAPMAGALPLRDAISRKIERIYSQTYNPTTEICVTSGATEAIFSTINALLSVGDEVIIFEPAFDIYAAAVKMAKATPKFIKLNYPTFEIDWNKVREAITPKTKLIIINSPHNPTGTILKKSDIEALNQLVQQHNILVLSDEVYEHLVFDQQQHHSVISHPELRQKSVVVFSLGKTYHVTGWRIGYCVAPEHLMARIKNVHQYVTFAAATPLQLALAHFLDQPTSYQNLAPFLQQKRDLFLQAMETSDFEPLPSSGTYFQLMKYQQPKGDFAYAEELVRTHKVATIPISYFYHDKTDHRILRFCFAKENNELLQAADKFQRH